MSKPPKAPAHTSNRKAHADLERKVAYKSVLENPFHLPWPSIPLNVQNSILAAFIDVLNSSGIEAFREERRVERLKAKGKSKERRTRRVVLERRVLPAAEEMDHDQAQDQAHGEVVDDSNLTRPEILDHLVLGINAVTKLLEGQARALPVAAEKTPAPAHVDDNGEAASSSAVPDTMDEDALAPNEPTPGPSKQKYQLKARKSNQISVKISLVLVCQADINPQILISHIPHLVAACNARAASPEHYVKLATLPLNSEVTLAQLAGVRRVAVVGLDDTIAKDPRIQTLLQSVKPILAPWLVSLAPLIPPKRTHASIEQNPSENPTTSPKRRKTEANPQPQQTLIPTHIKVYKTTAPKDMKAAKALRAKGRAEAKQRKREKAQKEREAKKETSRYSSNTLRQ